MLSGCAWVFQEHLPSGYRKTERPHCSTGKGLATLDGVFAALNGIVAIGELANPQRTEDDSVLLASAVIWTVVHTASAVSGNGWANECREAQDNWDEEPTPPLRARTDIEDERVVAPARPVRAAPRGFYCATSSSQPMVGMCSHSKQTCLATANALRAAVADLDRCELTENAFCFDAGSGNPEERCAPTAEACTSQHDSAIADGAAVGPCVETE